MNSMRFFLSGMAFLISILAVAISSFTAYKISNLEKSIETLSRSGQNNSTPSSNPGSMAEDTSSQGIVSTPVDDSAPPSNSVGIQPGQFVQFSSGNKAQVELLSVKRIKDPATGTRDVVNVQFRVRRLSNNKGTEDPESINADKIVARNPETSETYEALKNDKASTGLVQLISVKRGSSLDAYVWLNVPEGANALDIYVPSTQVFKNVPVSS